jgi:hypothetical protein
MAERDDRMAEDARNAQSGQQAGQQGSQAGGDDRQALDQALRRKNEDLAGDIETNRNLSGSTTYETLSEQGDLDVATGRTDAGSRGSQGGNQRDDQSGSSGSMR